MCGANQWRNVVLKANCGITRLQVFGCPVWNLTASSLLSGALRGTNGFWHCAGDEVKMCRWNQDRVWGGRHVETAELVFPVPSPDTSQAQHRSPTTFALSSGLQIALSAWICPAPLPCALQGEILSLHSSPDVGLALGMVILWPFCAGGNIPTHRLRLDSHLS